MRVLVPYRVGPGLMGLLFLLFTGCSQGLRTAVIPGPDPGAVLKLGQQPARLQWQVQLPSSPQHVLAVNPDGILVISHRGEVLYYDLNRARRRGRIWQPFRNPVNSLYLDRNQARLYLLSDADAEIVSYDLKNSRPAWKSRVPESRGQIALIDSLLFCVRGAGTIQALAVQDGHRVREKRLRSKIRKGLLSYNQELILLTEAHTLEFFTADLVPTASLAVTTTANPVWGIDHGHLLIGDSAGRFYCINLKTKHLVFSRTFPAAVFAIPVYTGPTIVCALADGLVVGLDPEDGSEVWTYQGSGLVNAPLLDTGSTVLVPFARGSLTALSASTGVVIWQHQMDRVLRGCVPSATGFLCTDQENLLSSFGAEEDD